MLCVNEGDAAQLLCSLLNSTAQDGNGLTARAMNHHLHPTVILLSGLSEGSLHASTFFLFGEFSLVRHVCLEAVTVARSKGCQVNHI